jgi:hypothetical protein
MITEIRGFIKQWPGSLFNINNKQDKLLRSVPISVYKPGDNILAPGLPNKIIRVSAFSLQGAGTVSAKFKSGSNMDLTGLFNLTSALSVFGISLAQPSYLFSAISGSELILNLSAFITVSGFVTYFYDDIGASTDNTWTLNDSTPVYMGMTFGS